MNDRLFAFSVRMGVPHAGYSSQQFEERKRSIRNLLELLMPAAKSLIFAILEEEVVANENEILLNFYLVEPCQGAFDFEEVGQDKPSGNRREGLLAKFYQRLILLKESALNSHLTIAELSELLIAIAGGDPVAAYSAEEANTNYELIRGLLRHDQKPFKLSFPDEDLLFQLPLIPKCMPDPIDRMLDAKIISISSLSAIIQVFNDDLLLESKSAGQARHSRKVAKFNLLRPDRADKVQLGRELQLAMDTDTRLTIRVRLAREVVTGQVSHLELYAILNADEVRDVLSY